MRSIGREEEVTVDFTFIRELSGDCDDLVIEIMEIFSDTAPLNMLEMKARLKQGDYGAVQRMAHKLKSSVNFFGNDMLLVLLNEIEHFDFMAPNFNTGYIKALTDQLDRIISTLVLMFSHDLMELRKAS